MSIIIKFSTFVLHWYFMQSSNQVRIASIMLLSENNVLLSVSKVMSNKRKRENPPD